LLGWQNVKVIILNMMDSWESWGRNIWTSKWAKKFWKNIPWSRVYLDANENWKTEKPMPLSRPTLSSVW